MKAKTCRVIFIALASVVTIGVSSLYVVVGPALPYLRLLYSGDKAKMFRATEMLEGYFRKGLDARGNVQVEKISGHKPLRGYAKRLIDQKIIDVLSVTDDIDLIHQLLFTCASMEEKKYSVTGDCLYSLTNAINKANADLRILGEKYYPGREEFFSRFELEENSGAVVLRYYSFKAVY